MYGTDAQDFLKLLIWGTEKPKTKIEKPKYPGPTNWEEYEKRERVFRYINKQMDKQIEMYKTFQKSLLTR